MSLSLYTDVHVPFAVTRQLRIRGVDVLTAQDDGNTQLSDPKLLDRATELGRSLVTQDDDLLVEAQRRQGVAEHFAGVIYGHQLGVTIGQMTTDLELIAKACDLSDVANRVEYLPL